MKFLALQALSKSGPDPASQQQQHPAAEKGGTGRDPPSPHFTADLHCCACTLPMLASRRDAPEPRPHQGRPGRAIGCPLGYVKALQPVALVSFSGRIYLPLVFSGQPAEGWLETPQSTKAGSSMVVCPRQHRERPSSAPPFIPLQRPSSLQGFYEAVPHPAGWEEPSQRAGSGPPVRAGTAAGGRASEKGLFCSAQPPGDTGIHPGTSGSCWEGGGVDPREAGASLKPYPWPQVKDQLHLPASPLEPDSP